ncbi:MAG: class I SAM-dependent methyltransferase [Blastocatellia bacterium]
MNSADGLKTEDEAYSNRLLIKESVWWKRLINAQAPYRWNLHRLNLGFTLDIGCGLGRNLVNLDGNGVGVDHNERSVEIARSRGLRAFTADDFQRSPFNAKATFDSLLLSHVAEHMTEQQVIALMKAHLHLVKPGGQVIIITPQESGYRSDPTHVQFTNFESLRRIVLESGLIYIKEYSFPFPRVFGRLFKYNEFVCVSKTPG